MAYLDHGIRPIGNYKESYYIKQGSTSTSSNTRMSLNQVDDAKRRSHITYLDGFFFFWSPFFLFDTMQAENRGEKKRNRRSIQFFVCSATS